MADIVPNPSDPEWLRARGRALAAAAPYVAFGLAALGPIRAAVPIFHLATAGAPSWADGLVAGLLALAELVLFAVVGWGAGQLVRLAAAGIDLALDRAESARRTAELIERQVAPALERLAAGPPEDGRARALAEVRQAIEAGHWERAHRLAEGFARDFPGAAEADRIAAEVARGRDEAIADLRARLDAAREAGDPDAVLDRHDELGRLLGAGPRAELDRPVIGWLMGLIQKRMWAGTVRADVAGLAARVADRFGHTREGASLRASLPTLRRSAGLCPRCGQPDAGLDDACPSCLAGGRGHGPGAGEGDSAGPSAGQLDGGEASDKVE